MITVKEIENLANLARIKLNDDEKQGLTTEIGSILTYIDQIKSANVDMDQTASVGVNRNIFRDDIAEVISGDDREALLNEAPNREKDFIAVKKIIAQD